MANQYQSNRSFGSNGGNANANNSNGGNNGYQNRRPVYAGTPALMSPDENTGQTVLATLAIHQLNDGTFAVVNGNAITTDDNGNPMAIDASKGYQSVDAGKLAAAIGNAKAVYTCDLNCGPVYGVQEARLFQLSDDDAIAFGVDKTVCEHVDEDAVIDKIDGIIGVSASAYLSLLESQMGVVPSPVTYRKPRVLDTFPFERGLALARAHHPATDFEIENANGERVVITAFPRGNQRDQEAQNRKANAIAASALKGLNTGRKPV